MVAKKIGMTQLFLENGDRVPVTVLSVKGNTVLAHRTDDKHGYTAIQVGFDEQKPSRMTKADLGRFKQAGATPRRVVKEFRLTAEDVEKYPVGQELPLEIFAEGGQVDITGITKGKGFQGVIKRHNMRGTKNSHGVHEVYRHGGSIGCRLTPGRVVPGKKMAGHMGTDRQTLQNVHVAKVMADEGVLLVRGPVPGSNGSYVTIRTALKPAIKAANNKKKKK